MEHTLKDSSVLHSKLKPLYWAMLPFMLFGMNQYATAATVYWDGVDTTSGNGVPIGGVGTWDTTTTNWTNDAAGTSNQAWVAGDNAVFGGAGGTVTVVSQSVGDITFSSDGYNLTKSVFTSGIFFANPVNSYTVTNSEDTATISMTVGFSGGISPNALTKLGDGKLILIGPKNFSGDTNISAGTLEAQSFIFRGNIINNGSFIFSNEADGGSFHYKSISGSGTLTKTGAGSLSLSGTNTYTGATTISAGILRTSNTSALGSNSAVTVGGGSLELTKDLSIGSLAGTGNVTLNNNTLTTGGNNTSTSYSGILSGAGGLTKQGSGTQTLSGANTYTGDTTIADGTLQLGSSNRIADTSNLVINDGKFDLNGFNETVANLSGTGGLIDLGNTGNNSLTVNQTVDGTYAGNFAGNNSNPNSFNSSLIKNGNATLTLSGTSTQTGGNLITIIAGRLAVTGGNAIADTYIVNGSGEFELLGDETIGFLMMNSAGKVLLNNNTLTIGTTSGASTAAYNRADISGSGNIVINGVGNQLFNGASTYTGSTTINSGKLSALNSSALGNNSAVTVNTAGTLELANDLSIGSLAGDGTVNLSGSGSNSLSIGGDNTSTVFSGVVSGAGGGLTKTGTGNLNLTGVNTYTGTTTINGGILSVNGSIANSATTVNTNGQLGGNGTVGSVTLAGGTIAPGNSIGALNVNGNVDFSGGGIYAVEVDDAGNNDVINATGTATLTNGSVQVKPEAGSYNVSTDYTILTATGGLGGTTFGSASSDLAFLTPTLSYDANNVFLNLRRNTSDYAGVSGTINQAAVGTSLDTFFQTNNDSLDTIYNNLNTLTAEGARQAYDSLSGVQHTHSSQIALHSVNQFQSVLFDRIQGNNALLANNGTVMLAYNDSGTMSDTGPQLLNNSVDTQRGWWLRAIGNEGKIDSTTNASGTEYKAGGIATGFDYNLTNNLTIGTALGYTSANADVEQGRLNADSYQFALYGKLNLNNDYYVSGTAGIGTQKTKASRNVTVGLSSLVATSNYDARTANVAIEGGRKFTLNENTSITPFAGLEYAHVNRDGFTETGAGSANLKVNSDYQESLRSMIGTRIAHSWTTKQGYQIQPNAELAWVHENMDNESTLRAGFEPATNTSFTVYGPKLNRDHARVGLGLNVQFNETTSLNLGYQGEIAASDERHDVTATFRMVW